MNQIERPSPNADIQIGDRVEILGNTPDSGLPVYGRVTGWSRMGNQSGDDGQPRRVSGSRLRKSRS